MSNFTIVVDDAEIRAVLKRLHDVGQNMRPILQDIGEGVMERTKKRFNTSTDPAGNQWLQNSQTTYSIIAARLGKSSVGKSGRINSKGAAILANKKPLIGESGGRYGGLSKSFNVSSDNNSVNVASFLKYAAMHQFGGTTSPRSMIPNVKIPARPFLPVTIDGELYPQERQTILNQLNELLQSQIFAK